MDELAIDPDCIKPVARRTVTVVERSAAGVIVPDAHAGGVWNVELLIVAVPPGT